VWKTKSIVPFDVDPPIHDQSTTEVVLPFHSGTDTLETERLLELTPPREVDYIIRISESIKL